MDMSVLFLLILGLAGMAVLGLVVAVAVALTNKDAARQAWLSLALVIPIALILGVTLFGFMLTGRSVDYQSTRSIEFPSDAAASPMVPQEIRPDIPEPAVEASSDEEPATTPEPASPSRPEWVDAPPERIDSGDVYQTSVSVGPFLTRHECDRAMPAALGSAVATFIADYVNPQAASRVSLPNDYIRRNIVKDQFTETVELDPKTEVLLEGEEAQSMVRLHARLQFDRSVKTHIEQLWRRSVVAERLWIAGFALGAVLLLLLILFAVLKIDRATDGKARGRLTLGVGGVMILLLLTTLIGMRILAGARAMQYGSGEAMVPANAQASSTAEVRVSRTSNVTSSDATTSNVKIESHARAAGGTETVVTAHGPTWLLIAPGFLLILLTIAGLIALLAFKKTRPVGLAILALLVLGSLVMVA